MAPKSRLGPNMEHIQNIPWSKCTLSKRTMSKHTLVKTYPGTKHTLVKTYLGTKHALVKTYPKELTRLFLAALCALMSAQV